VNVTISGYGVFCGIYWLTCAVSRTRLSFSNSRSLRWLNRGASAGMVGAAVAIALE